MGVESDRILDGNWISVPIRGLFNLTKTPTNSRTAKLEADIFPSPSGDYLI